jgi:methylated-DNA-[protein]-cysteine S-methyltransferase
MNPHSKSAPSGQDYQARVPAPFGVLGIRCTSEKLCGIEFLPSGSATRPPDDDFTHTVCRQLEAYFNDPDFRFNLPFAHNGTQHQIKVWQAMNAIPRGQTRSYGNLAVQIASSARAVGQACGANPLPIVIPCHRIVAKAAMGGFMHSKGGYQLDIKRWLLAHEGAQTEQLS